MLGGSGVTSGGEGQHGGTPEGVVGCGMLATGALLAAAATAQAQRPASLGDGTPWGQTGIQLYDFNNYLSRQRQRARSPVPPPTPDLRPAARPTTASARRRRRRNATRLERVFEVGELEGHPQHRALRLSGQPVPGHQPGDAGQRRRPAGAARAR